jgi:hypothetical protein
MNWDLTDFVVFGALVASAGSIYMFGAKQSDNGVYRLAMGVAAMAFFLLVWVILGVGALADSGDSADLMYAGVFAVGLVGAILGRFQPRGMAFALLATSVATALVAVIALIAGMHRSPISSVAEVLGVNGIFVALFAGSAGLFWYASRKQAPITAG